MGKRKTVISAIENQENLAPEFHTQHTEEKMQTRSTKAPSSTESSPQKEYPAISLINSLTEQSKLQSPTQTAEQIVTPSKDESTAIVTIQSEDTPTTNLKILCEVADDQEVVEGAHIILSQGESSDGNIEVQPVTPTSNLKMLITAASPEIRTLEMTKTRLFTEGEAMIVTEPGEDHDYYDDEVMSSQEAGGSGKKSCRRSSGAARKERSLGLLCQRFMNEFDPHPPQTARIEVCLDELASHLGTERRRIYDIVNVLESVEIMSRRAKNRYLWHGRTLLNATLVKLKHFAESEKIGQQMELLKEMEVSRMYGKKSELDTEDIKRHPKFEEYMKTFGHAYKKDRSLGVMSQKFLMIFLVSSSKTINLDLAAKVLLGDPLALEGSRSNSQFKTKIRRLYDIANIFASLDLICKVHVTEVRGRKPAFSYIGPDVDHLASLDEYQYLKNVEVTRPGRTTLEMKMDELKHKMEETISNDKLTGVSSQSKTVPPVAIEPDLSKVKLRLPDINSSPAPGSQKATSLLNKPSVLILPSITSSQIVGKTTALMAAPFQRVMSTSRQRQTTRLDPAFRLVRQKTQTSGPKLTLTETPLQYLSAFRKEEPLATRELIQENEIKLRKNKTTGAYVSDLDYLDVQFRLLREDLVNSLREAIYKLKRNPDDRNLRKVYRNLTFIGPQAGRKGITYQLKLDLSTREYQFAKKPGSKNLQFGSLLALSTDQFKSVFVFATIAESTDIPRGGYFDVTILDQSRTDFQEHFEVPSQSSKHITITAVESEAFCEAYIHVLKALQRIDDVPFSKYIVSCQSNVSPPAYLRSNQSYRLFDLKDNPLSSMPRADLWPRAMQLGLNQSQFDAFKLALTHELAVIQGPPGTGKTFVGTRVVQVLLHNLYAIDQGDPEKTVASEPVQLDGLRRRPAKSRIQEKSRRINTPLLMVCYTNHALDQFLEETLKFCSTDDVTRVGSRSSSVLLQSCNLRNKNKQGDGYGREMYELVEESKLMQRQEDLIRLKQKLRNSKTSLIFHDHLSLPMYFSSEFDRLARKFPKDRQKFTIFYWLECEASQFSFRESQTHFKEFRKNRAEKKEVPKNEFIELLMNDTRRLEEDEDELENSDETAHSEKNDGDNVKIEYQLSQQLNDLSLNDDPSAGNASISSAGAAAGEDDDGEFSMHFTNDDRKKARTKMTEELKKSDRHDAYTERIIQVKKHKIEQLALSDRWKLYRKWIHEYRVKLFESVQKIEDEWNKLQDELAELSKRRHEAILSKSKIIGMTTTGAARYHDVLERIGPEIIIIEEAAEVLEAHVISTLSSKCKHLILIGDHKQLRPSPNVYQLETDFNLDLSLFERLVNNKIPYVTLSEQHRMRPEISQFITNIYPQLENHYSVYQRPNVNGVTHPVFFIDHKKQETLERGSVSKSNQYEAEYIVKLCEYLMKQNYKPEEITILTMYMGQLRAIRQLMPIEKFIGVKLTSVDNFQGEENKIILLSLVRSNDDGNLGFVKIENRICVAMSRAREGLYVIGNMSLMEAGSDLWRKMIHQARTKHLISLRLPIHCVRHEIPKYITHFADFDTKVNRLGGCHKSCREPLACGHVCQLPCHYVDSEHLLYKCSQPCAKMLNCGHPCDKYCYEECKCRVKITVRLTDCGHRQTIQCYQKELDVDCLTLVQVRCWRCKATSTKACYQKDYPCDKPCTYTLPCGHQCAGSCGRCVKGHPMCDQVCGDHLGCGHDCPQKCAICSKMRSCPPCKDYCPFTCSHGKQCQIKCSDHDGKDCLFHNDKCSRECPHQKCKRLCGEPCKLCMRSCDRRGECFHCAKRTACKTFCGEDCLFVCTRCLNNCHNISASRETNQNCVRLGDCGHVFEAGNLERLLKKESAVCDARYIPRCPDEDCRRAITELRYRHFLRH